MVEQFFSLRYAGRSDLFERLSIWNSEKFRSLQGTYPVISLSFANVKESIHMDMPEVVASLSLYRMSDFLTRYYGKKVIILLDEYDTPMQEAYVDGFWEELVGFMRSMFNTSFKTNPWLERAIMTGITRVSKESVFSDLCLMVKRFIFCYSWMSVTFCAEASNVTVPPMGMVSMGWVWQQSKSANTGKSTAPMTSINIS